MARATAVAPLAVSLALALTAAPALAGWQAPFRVAGPYSVDVLPAQLAFSPAGQPAFGFTVQNEDRPPSSQAFEAVSSQKGKPGGVRSVPDTQQLLDLAFAGSDLTLLVGTGPARRPCCSSARLVKVAGGGPQGARTVITKLTGATVGRLLALPGHRLLSVVATAQAVWAELTRDTGRPAPPRLLTPATAAPQTLTATVLRGNHTVVAWSAALGPPAPSTAGPTSIVVADGSAQRAPRAPHVAVTVAAGHQIDELALGRGSGPATAAWIESWGDSAAHPHSEPVIADLGRRVQARSYEIPGLLASGVSLATEPGGAQVLAWKACALSGDCRVEAATKDRAQRFGRPVDLGPIDASQAPATAISGRGVALVGWTDQGRVLAATRARRAGRFAPGRVVSGTNSAKDLTVGFGPTNSAVAAWSQGTFTETVMAAAFKP